MFKTVQRVSQYSEMQKLISRTTENVCTFAYTEATENINL